MAPCEKYKSDLLKMVDNELEGDARRSIQLHLEACPACEAFVNELLQLRSALKSLSPIEASEGFQYILRERIRREMAGKGRQSKQWIAYGVPAFASLAVVFVSGYLFLNRTSPNPLEPQGVASQPAVQSQPYDVDYVLNSDPVVEEVLVRESVTPVDSAAQARHLQAVQARITPVSF